VSVQGIVRQPGEHAVAIVLIESEGALPPGKELSQWSMSAFNCLRSSGRTRSKREIREIVWSKRHVRRGRWIFCQLKLIFVARRECEFRASQVRHKLRQGFIERTCSLQ